MRNVREANARAIDRLCSARPFLVDMRPAIEVIPGMSKATVLHAGPPIPWDRMCPAMRAAVAGALCYEGLYPDPTGAVAGVGRGEVALAPCHAHGAVGGMTGVLSASMPVYVVEDRTHGTRAFSYAHEGWGRALRYGCYDDAVRDRLRWIEQVFGPAVGSALRASGGIDLHAIIAEALLRGDECHNRFKASTSMFVETLAALLLEADIPRRESLEVLRFVSGNHQFFVTIAMAACKAALDAAHGIPGSTLVTAMARNGTDFGIRVSGTGDHWFTAPSPRVRGLYFPGYGEADAGADMGDSAITETAGLGGFAMAAAPALVQLVGGTAREAAEMTLRMYEITLTEHPHFRIPALDFRGTPTGIDVRRVVETGIPPRLNTAICHREAGVGMIGAGLVEAPLPCFTEWTFALFCGLTLLPPIHIV